MQLQVKQWLAKPEMRFVYYFLSASLGAALTLWALTGQVIGPSKLVTPATIEFSYSDFVSATLTALGLILAALAIGIGIVAFRTIGEIKREAQRIAEDHAKKSLEQQVRERLPAEIDAAVEKLGREGRLDEALQKAIMQISVGGGVTNAELQPTDDEQSEIEVSHDRS